MEIYTCIIVDDDEMDRQTLLACLESFPQFRVVGIFSSAERALSVVNEIQVDVLFLDIQMPGLNGIEFRKKVEEIPVCVYISYSPEYAAESYELETLDYIVKPLSEERFSKTVSRIGTFMEMRKKEVSVLEKDSQADEFYIKDGIKQIRVKQHEILYLEALKDYTLIVTESGKYSVFSALSALLGQPNFSSFIRIHRSYAVNKKRIHKITRTEVALEDGSILPVGRAYKNNLFQLL